MIDSFCCCPGCGECKAHANEPKLKARLKALEASHRELLAALEALLPHTDNLEDAGPVGEGWMSAELRHARSDAESAIAKAKEVQP